MSALADQPAFPSTLFSTTGLTVRQHMALHIEQSLIVATVTLKLNAVTIADKNMLAARAIEYADALIAALEEKK